MRACVLGHAFGRAPLYFYGGAREVPLRACVLRHALGRAPLYVYGGAREVPLRACEPEARSAGPRAALAARLRVELLGAPVLVLRAVVVHAEGREVLGDLPARRKQRRCNEKSF